MAAQTYRVMWLLNHTTARRFEVAMLNALGIREIFLPKIHPVDPGFRSASIDYSQDAHLSIPAEDLEALNRTDWYGDIPKSAWDIANRHFSTLIFLAQRGEAIESISRNFRGAIIWRAYGLDKSLTYSKLLSHLTRGVATIERARNRFWFGEAYAHLHESETGLIRDRPVFLPLGMLETKTQDDWVGDDPRLFFVCPDIGVNPYYEKCYKKFRKKFGDLPYVIGGAQPIAVDDPAVLGFVSADEHRANMRRLRVMYYHSKEPNHIHYHPFEVIQAGMPLVFRGGGILDRLGGIGLPGRAASAREARDKIKRILKGDRALIDAIRQSQGRLLESISFEACLAHWRDGFAKIEASASTYAVDGKGAARKPKRIAVIVPAPYRGGTLRGAKLLAEALLLGSRESKEDVEIVLAHLDDEAYDRSHFGDLPKGISVRAYKWRTVTKKEAQRAMRFAGHSSWLPEHRKYRIPDDSMQQFCDCDLWIVVSDRLAAPLLPVRPYCMAVFDYIQRYVDVGVDHLNAGFFRAARSARRVLVTTQFTRNDALQFGGLDPARVIHVPMLVPKVALPDRAAGSGAGDYFIWTTNAAPHKNHESAFEALRIYYEELGGSLRCRVTGSDTSDLLNGESRHLRRAGEIHAQSPSLREKLDIEGELPERTYLSILAGAAFLWHPALIDNGTFSLVEAAQLGVPALSSDYPAIREMERQFNLSLRLSSRDDPRAMAEQLKWMEQHAKDLRAAVPDDASPGYQPVETFAHQYWEAVRECL